MTAKDAAAHVRLLGGLAKALAESSEITARTERLVAGAPTHHGRIDHMVVTMDAAEFQKQLVALNRRHAAELEAEDVVIEAQRELPAPEPVTDRTVRDSEPGEEATSGAADEVCVEVGKAQNDEGGEGGA